MSRSKTTSIPRPAGARASDAGRSRFGDLTGAIPVEKSLWRGSRVALMVGALFATVVAAVAAAVFVLPIGTWREQSVDIERREDQLGELQRVNNELEAEVLRLETSDGVREAAREDYGYVEEGEERASVLPLPPLPTDLPDGWPYSVVDQIIDIQLDPPPEPTLPATTVLPEQP